MEILKDYVAAPKMFVEGGAPLRAGLFVYMPINQTLVLYRPRGHELTLDELIQIKKMENGRLFVSREEYASAIAALSAQIAKEVGSQGVNSPATQRMVSTAFKGMSPAANLDPAEARAIVRKILDDSAQILMDVVLEFKSSKKMGDTLRETLQRLGKDDASPVITHNRHVAAMAALIMMSFGVTSEEDIADMVLAGLIHDTGLELIPPVFADKHLKPDENTIGSTFGIAPEVYVGNYRQHVRMALEHIKTLKVPVSEQVSKIITSHHENLDGTGLFGLTNNDLDPLCRAFRIADDLIALMNHSDRPCGIDEAIARLEAINEGAEGVYYDAKLLKGLRIRISES